ncbi:MAG: MAPEG family protein [Gammaproteobacteria bacterium]|nr:MAPEG family protein [Gammaproteobacteria bacterium]
MEPVAIVTALILVQYVTFGFMVGQARGRSGIKAPATTGDPVFERHFCAHQNSLEQMVATIPALLLFGYYVNAQIGAVIGVVYLIGRSLYYRTYVAEPASRGPGFAIGFLATVILILGGLAGAGWQWLL